MNTSDTEDEKPFSFTFHAEVDSIITDLRDYLEFSKKIEKLIKAGESKLQGKISEGVKKVPEEEQIDVNDNYDWERHQYQNLFPSMHRESMFITLYNFLEHNLNEVCKKIGNELESKSYWIIFTEKESKELYYFLKKSPSLNLRKSTTRSPLSRMQTV
ncbi:MAG: hypothetical protein PHW04_00065 [Candidatus Wallbacteria bacterium]|nr:hypothetical protein [Candidatus Wallbacteria bacterium]